MHTDEFNTSDRYSVESRPGIAFYFHGYVDEETYEGDILVCDDEDCDHGMSEMCWAMGDTSISRDMSAVRMIMVGDDRIHYIDPDEVTKISEDDYCSGCGQIGCGH